MAFAVKFGRGYLDIGLTSADISMIQATTPVLTGLLQRSFTLKDGDIVNPVYYGGWVEAGTSKIPPRRMVALAIPYIAEKLEKRILDQLDKIDIFDLPKR